MSGTDAAKYSKAGLTSILVSAVLGYALDGYNMLILSFLMPDIEKSMGISEVEAGVIFSMQLIASIFGGALFGHIADRIGRRNGLMLSIILFSIGALLSGLCWDFGSLLVFRLLTGLGLGGEWGLGMALFNEAWPRRRRGFGAGVIQSSFLVGIFGAGLVASAMTESLGPDAWRWALMTGFAPVVIGIGVRFWMPESHLWEDYNRLRRSGNLPSDKEQKPPLVEIFRGRTLRMTVYGLLLVAGFMLGFYALTSFVPSLIKDGYHTGASTYANVNTAVVWFTVPFYLGFGALSDFWGRKKAFLVPCVAMLAGSVLFYFSTSQATPYPGSIWSWGVFWSYCVWYIGTAVSALFGVWLSEIFPVDTRATAVSVTYMLGRGASAISPIIVPALVGLHLIGGIGPSMALLSVIGVVIMMVFGFLLPETRGRRFHSVEYVAGAGEPVPEQQVVDEVKGGSRG